MVPFRRSLGLAFLLVENIVVDEWNVVFDNKCIVICNQYFTYLPADNWNPFCFRMSHKSIRLPFVWDFQALIVLVKKLWTVMTPLWHWTSAVWNSAGGRLNNFQRRSRWLIMWQSFSNTSTTFCTSNELGSEAVKTFCNRRLYEIFDITVIDQP
jgi:hypothetical protein